MCYLVYSIRYSEVPINSYNIFSPFHDVTSEFVFSDFDKIQYKGLENL